MTHVGVLRRVIGLDVKVRQTIRGVLSLGRQAGSSPLVRSLRRKERPHNGTSGLRGTVLGCAGLGVIVGR